MQRIFARFLDGDGLHRIATDLTRAGILSPSAHDPSRNSHRVGSRGAWAKSAVRAILANPRYTGHQVWNKQRRDEVLVDVEDVGLGHESKMRWNDKSQWVWSEQPVHEALVDIETFEAAQSQFGRTTRTARRTPSPGRHYLLSGIMRCGLCGRRMQAQWNHDKARTGAHGRDRPVHHLDRRGREGTARSRSPSRPVRPGRHADQVTGKSPRRLPARHRQRARRRRSSRQDRAVPRTRREPHVPRRWAGRRRVDAPWG
ncbi:MAG: recombinase family protein [Actinobacteria bacterium]|nr:recombinase family protein [Actinomycetota bacterium]